MLNTELKEFTIIDCSPEGKALIEEKLSEVAASLVAAYDSGELTSALEEGHSGWQKWVKSFGKSLKRKVMFLQKGFTYFFPWQIAF